MEQYEHIQSQFNESMIGSVALPIEPLSSRQGIEALKQSFAEAYVTAVPIEKDGGVIGLVQRSVFEGRHASAWESLRGKELTEYMTKGIQILDARENMEKVLNTLFSKTKRIEHEDFLVYNYGKFHGVVNFEAIVRQVSNIRNRELERAKKIQSVLMTEESIPKGSVSVFFRPAHELGGDSIQQLKINDRLFCTAAFDVAGKGISASLATGLISSFYKTAQLTGWFESIEPQTIIQELNATLFSLTPPDVFITAGFLFMDLEKDSLFVANCGFEPIFVFEEADGKVKGKLVKSSTQPLGLSDELKPVLNTFSLQNPAKYLMYSDGVIDIKNSQGERFGEDRLQEVLKSSYKMSANHLVAVIESELTGFMGKAPQADDISLLCLEI
jgi:serine phosphatase RsbU (regulator of sigma subunit)